MKKVFAWLVGIAVLGILCIASVAGYMWFTIPPAPDPETLPSRQTVAPPARFGDAVAEGTAAARNLVADEKLPGLSLAVAVEGEVVWAEGFRWADMESETPVTPETLFRIGGVSATLVSAAVGLLRERGDLDLDAAIQEYVPDYPEKEWPVTVRQLMSHTSGIRPHRGEGGIYQGVHCAADAGRLALIAADPLHGRPGTEQRYSTHGWNLVAAAVATASGEPWLTFLEREVLSPLGMDHTLPELAGTIEPGSATFYYPRLMLDPRYGLQDCPEVDLSCFLPAVGFLSTPSDLARFGAAMMRGRILDPATVRELQTPVRLLSGDFSQRALGWVVSSIPLGRDGTPTVVAGQGLGNAVLRFPLGVETAAGHVAGATTVLILVPEYDLAIAAATNVSGSDNVSLLAIRLADAFVRSLESR